MGKFSMTEYREFQRALDTALLAEDKLDVAIEWIRRNLAPADVFDNVHGEGDCDHDECVTLDEYNDIADELKDAEKRTKELEDETNSQQTKIDDLEAKVADLENTIRSLENELSSR